MWEGFLCKITYMLESFPLPEICHLIVSLGLSSTTLLTPSSPPPVQERRQSPLAELQLNIKSWCANGDGVSWRAGTEEWRRRRLLPPPVSFLPIIEVSFLPIKSPGKFRSCWGTHSHLDPKLESDLGGKLLESRLSQNELHCKGIFKWMLLAQVIHPYSKPESVFSSICVPWACGFVEDVLHELQERASLWSVNSSREYTAPPGKNERQARTQMKWTEIIHH